MPAEQGDQQEAYENIVLETLSTQVMTQRRSESRQESPFQSYIANFLPFYSGG